MVVVFPKMKKICRETDQKREEEFHFELVKEKLP